MIEQQGRVVEVASDRACVRLGGTSGCSVCDSGKGCGAGVFGRLLKRRPVTLELENRVNAQRGQPVMVGIPEALYLRLVTRLYLLPLLAGLVGAAIGHHVAQLIHPRLLLADVAALLTGLLFGVAMARWTRKDPIEFPETNIVHLLRVIENQESGI